MGRISFHTAADASYKEMTLHCENLLMGKQQKISSLLNSQLRHESSVNCSPRQHDEEIKIASFHPMLNPTFHTEVCMPCLLYCVLNSDNLMKPIVASGFIFKI